MPTTYFYISTSFQATIIQALVGSKKVTLVKSISYCAQKSGAIFSVGSWQSISTKSDKYLGKVSSYIHNNNKMS